MLSSIKNQLSDLKLHGMLAVLETDLQIAVKQEWKLEEFLSKLLQSEREHQDVAQVERKIKFARFKRKASLEDFDWNIKRGVTKQQIQDLMILKWIEQARPLVFVGQTGVGKSFLAEALGRYACQQKKSVLFKDSTELFSQIHDARRFNRYLTMRDKLSRVDVLIIDDFGMRKLNATEAQDLKEILEIRSMSKSTVFTTQLPLNHWKEVIDDEVILDAVIDLIDHSALKFEMRGESYRKVKAKKLDEAQKEG